MKLRNTDLYLKTNISIIVLTFFVQLAFAQERTKRLVAKYTTEAMILDGILNEDDWQSADVANDFFQYFPNDDSKAVHNTEVKIMYNDETLYIGIRAETPNNNFVVSSLKRDFRGSRNDNVSIIFDTFNDGTNAFGFGVTPYGVRREFLVSNGGSRRSGYSTTWDVKWKAESKIYDGYYIAEMAIPLTSLKFEEGATKWRFRPYRWSVQTNEQSTWVKVPQTQFLGNLAFMGELIFEKPLRKSRTPFAVIPYVNTSAQNDYEEQTSNEEFLFGADAKVALGDGMNLDLTINPDFSNVEVDDIFTNLTRFEIQLPERRQFFIDNSDLFSSFGNFFGEAKPFFSRRIGLAKDTADNLIQNRIIAGARLSGKLDENWRLGFLNIQTARDSDLQNQISANNNMMFALQRKIAQRSNIGLFMVNREKTGKYRFPTNGVDDYNRVIGADFNLATADNSLIGRVYMHKSFSPDDKQGNYSSQALLSYNKNNWVFIGEATYVDNDFQADLGFVPRTDIIKTGSYVQRYFYPKNRKVINRNNTSLLFINVFKPTLDNIRTDYLLRGAWGTEFANRSELNVSLNSNFVLLTDDFDPSRSDDAVALDSGSVYNFSQLNLNYSSNNTKLLTYSLQTTLGQFYNGNLYSIGGRLSYRLQPWAQFSVRVNFDKISLPSPYSSASFWLVTPRADVTFSRNIFWTTLLQYSSQQENLGINSRLQWRFAPLSDLYLVYNDNYNTDARMTSFRSINLKLSYWLNI